VGVWIQKGKFIAEIRKDDIKYHLGTFETALGAALAYDEKAKEFGFDHINFKDDNV